MQHVVNFVIFVVLIMWACFFFQAEDGIRDLVRSRGLGDVYKRQGLHVFAANERVIDTLKVHGKLLRVASLKHSYPHLSLIHI